MMKVIFFAFVVSASLVSGFVTRGFKYNFVKMTGAEAEDSIFLIFESKNFQK